MLREWVHRESIHHLLCGWGRSRWNIYPHFRCLWRLGYLYPLHVLCSLRTSHHAILLGRGSSFPRGFQVFGSHRQYCYCLFIRIDVICKIYLTLFGDHLRPRTGQSCQVTSCKYHPYEVTGNLTNNSELILMPPRVYTLVLRGVFRHRFFCQGHDFYERVEKYIFVLSLSRNEVDHTRLWNDDLYFSFFVILGRRSCRACQGSLFPARIRATNYGCGKRLPPFRSSARGAYGECVQMLGSCP